MQSGPAGRASVVMTAKAGYGLLAAAAGAFSLIMWALGQIGYLVLFGAISLYFLQRVARRRRAPAGAATPADAMQDRERGGFPLVVIAVTGMLLAVSAASFAMNVAAFNRPDNGICDYDRAAADAVDETTAVNGTATPRREFCDDHTGYFLLANPFDPYSLQPTSVAGVTYLDRPITFWVPLFSVLWAVFALFMITASVNPGSAAGRKPLLVICGYGRGVLAMATVFAATLLFILVAAGLAARLAGLALRPGSLAALLDTVGLVWLLYAVMMIVVAAFLATFFRRRGGG